MKKNIKITPKNKLQMFKGDCPNLRTFYEEFLESENFKELICTIKKKYNYEYTKLFFRHSLNFINYYFK